MPCWCIFLLKIDVPLAQQFFSAPRALCQHFSEQPLCAEPHLQIPGPTSSVAPTQKSSENMGVSENRLVPLNPMVLLIIIPLFNGYFIGNIPNIFRQTHMAGLGVGALPLFTTLCAFSTSLSHLPPLQPWISFSMTQFPSFTAETP